MAKNTTPHVAPLANLHEAQVLHGLSLEWELALVYLSTAERRRLRPPLFRLADLGQRLGQWDAGRREICLNRLLLNQPWEALREVLRHEMAHQLVSELDATSESQAPHGAGFRNACQQLRIEAHATRGIASLGGLGSPSGTADPTEGIVGRIRKLLALAGSPNPHEAEAAMLKAHTLIRRHHLGSLEAGQSAAAPISRCVGQPALRQPREAYALALLLVDFYFVAGIWVPSVVVAKGTVGRVLEISGSPSQVETAIYVHAFVHRFIESRWQELRSSRQRRCGSRCRDFALGVIAGLRERLTATTQPLPARHAPSSSALTAAANPQLSAYMAWRYPRTSRIQRGGGQIDAQLAGHGKRLGRELIIHRAIAGQGPTGGLLPSPVQD